MQQQLMICFLSGLAYFAVGYLTLCSALFKPSDTSRIQDFLNAQFEVYHHARLIKYQAFRYTKRGWKHRHIPRLATHILHATRVRPYNWETAKWNE
jgi:hypothetical protein